MPFLDYTSTAVPRNFAELMDWSEYMYLSGTEIREIFKRLFNYFNTDVDVTAIDSNKQSLDDGDARTWTKLISDELHWNTHVSQMMDNVAIYGNDFLSVVAPIQRYLLCDQCSSRFEIEAFSKMEGADFKYDKNKFFGRCRSSQCKQAKRGTREMEVKDLRIKDPGEFKIKHWPVREIALNHYLWTDETQIYWRIPEDYKRQVLKGDIKTLATADLGVLDAIQTNGLFRFKPDRIFHAKEPTLSGLKTRGWGLPRTLYLCRQAWTLQLIRKNVQALGIDFITPIRLLTPSTEVTRGSTGIAISPNTSVNHGEFARIVANIRSAHRRDPTTLHAAQVPMQYQLIGGEASQLFPEAIHQTAKGDLLEAGGFPVNIYQADLTIQAAPVGLRLFESQNRNIPAMMNEGLKFVANRVSELAGRDPIDARHQRVTLVDNLEISMARLQMAMSGQTSMTNALKPLNMNFQEEARQNARDQAFLMQLQTEQQEMLANQQGGMQMIQQLMQPPQDPNAQAAGGGGAPGGAPGGAVGPDGQPMMDPTAGMLPSNGLQFPMDITGLESTVAALAQTLGGMDPATRRRELSLTEQMNPTAHGILRTRLEQFDRQMASDGRQMMLQGGM